MPAPQHPALRYLLTHLLRDVSRSFFLTLRVLPGEIRPQIGLAYLLARATDTIADTDLLPLEQRLDALRKLRARILSLEETGLDLGDFALRQASPSEAILLDRMPEVLSAFRELDPADQELIREVLTHITRGQELDLLRFTSPVNSTSGPDMIRSLSSGAELDEYTYLVAGCVGEFWTKACFAHLHSSDGAATASKLLANAVRFGKGLQLVNILRDLPSDLSKGRCYIPSESLATIGLAPADLLRPEAEPRFRPVYNALLDEAEAHLRAGWHYTCALPRPWRRVRLACAWPVLIGLDTLKKLRTETVLNPDKRIKISRSNVRRIMFRSILALAFPKGWERLPEK